MGYQSACTTKAFLACSAIAIFIAGIAHPARAVRTPAPGKKPDVAQELVRTETGFFEAWKTKDLAYFRDHIAADGISWGKNGTFSREEQLQEQQNSAKSCTVEGYSLSDFSILPLATGAYLLIYRIDQYASCGGEKLPAHMNGSSIYILQNGRWLAIYRAEVPLENQR